MERDYGFPRQSCRHSSEVILEHPATTKANSDHKNCLTNMQNLRNDVLSDPQSPAEIRTPSNQWQLLD